MEPRNRTNLFLTNRHLQDINPLIAGEHICDPGYGVRPFTRKYTLIHYVIRGKGTLFARGQTFEVTAGQAFLIRTEELASYQADTVDPWHYRWVGFDGALSARFSELPAVFSLPEDIFRQIIRAGDDPSTAEYRIAAELLRLYARLFTKNSGDNRHVRRVENYIHAAYMLPIRVEDIANQLNLDRRYLSSLFKKKTGQSIQEYLISVRLEEAERHLRRGYSVKESANLVGFENVSNFSRTFKQHYGKSPSQITKA